LLIETPGAEKPEDSFIEPAALAQVILTLTELDAADLVVEIPVLSSGGGDGGGMELLPLFDEEFSLLGRNIRNLFEAIRVGSIPPAESARYVEDLVALGEAGKGRLEAALLRREGADRVRLERAAAAFGRVWTAGDLLSFAGETGGAGEVFPENPWYSRVRPDRDGTLRRIPLVRLEKRAPGGDEPPWGKERAHVIYGLFQDRSPGFGLERSPAGLVLNNNASPGDGELTIPLDKNGALLVELPREGADFRRAGLERFLEYEAEDRRLRRLLEEAEGRGLYTPLEPENYPSLCYDYALAYQEDLLQSPGEEKKLLWREARQAYFQSLKAFLSGPAERVLTSGYDELLGSGELDEAGAGRITGMKEELSAAFAGIRESYRRLLSLRQTLEQELSASLCILGPPGTGGGEGLDRRPLSAPEISAVLANALLTGRRLGPEGGGAGFGFSLALALGGLLLIRRRGPLFSLTLGLSLAVLVAAGFSYRFIAGSRWLDPLIPGGTAAAGSLFSALYGLALRTRFHRRFRASYGPLVTEDRLRLLLQRGGPRPGELGLSRAAVVAVRNSALMGREDREPPLAAARAVRAFHEDAARCIREAGGAVAGVWGDLVLGVFGSPLEGEVRKRRGRPPPVAERAPGIRAADLASGLSSDPVPPERAAWRFGIDEGDCSFVWSPLGGYGVFGHPVVRARILAGLASRYRARILISAAAGEAQRGALPEWELRRLGVLGGEGGQGKEPFYELGPAHLSKN
jgi:class 3 adenylate cyclase